MFLESLFTNPSHSVLLLSKGGLLLILFMFLIFMLIALKQVKAMNDILTQHELFPWIRAAAYAILMTTLVLFILTAVIL